MKNNRKEITIALTAIIAIALLFFGMNFLKGKQLFSSDNIFTLLFDDVSGLSASSPVYANGYKVGTVKEIRFNYNASDRVECIVGLDKQLQLYQGTEAEIASDLLGNVQVNLLMPTVKGKPLTTGATINGHTHHGALDKAAELIPDVSNMLPSLDGILANVNALTGDPALSRTLINTQMLTARLTATAQQLQTLAATLNHQLPLLVENAGTSLQNTSQFTSRLTEIDIDNTLQQINEAVSQMEDFARQLNDRNSSLGLLMNDSTLYRSLISTIGHADSLLVNLREHPKRYVHFSLFGRKDK